MNFQLKEFDESELKCHDLQARKCFISCNQGFYQNKNKENVQISDMVYNCLSKTKFYEDDYNFELLIFLFKNSSLFYEKKCN